MRYVKNIIGYISESWKKKKNCCIELGCQGWNKWWSASKSSVIWNWLREVCELELEGNLVLNDCLARVSGWRMRFALKCYPEPTLLPLHFLYDLIEVGRSRHYRILPSIPTFTRADDPGTNESPIADLWTDGRAFLPRFAYLLEMED